MYLMQNWILIVRKRLSSHFFIHSTQVSIFVLFAFSIMAFTPDIATNAGDIKISPTDSTDTTKGFVTLLGDSPGNNGEYGINANVMPFVETYIRQHENSYDDMKVWGKAYFNLYDKILKQYGLPVELKYLSVIESNLKSSSVSVAGAMGPWQIMPAEARRWGLRTGGSYDERKDYTKSTHAAAKLLRSLYDELGDWLLVIAAYNAGPGGVARAIKKAGSRNFYDLQYYLPAETRNHVKKYIATHYYFEGNGGLTTMTASETKASYANNKSGEFAFPADISMIEINGRYNSMVIANSLMIDIQTFNKLNPQLDNLLAQGNLYQLKIPKDKEKLFLAKKQEILKESVQLLLSSTAVSTSSSGTL